MKNLVLRKAASFANQVPRALARWRAHTGDYAQRPPILANSFPKSGTHLLLQVLRSIPGTRYYRSFIASMPSVTFRERSSARHVALIRSIVPGEVVPAHLFWHPSNADALRERRVIHFFIYRDPRDVAVSEAHYLTSMNRWHRLHRYYLRMSSFDDRLMAAIRGMRGPGFSYDYPDIAQRFARYAPWLTHPNVIPVRFEELVGPRRTACIQGLMTSYRGATTGGADVDTLAERALAAIDPGRSHTFREGRPGGWRNAFKASHVEAMRSVAETLLRELGYDDW